MGEVDTTEYEAQIDANKNLNKAEKKARKALAKLGLKQVPNVSRVTMKKAPSILFLIDSPEVFKSPASGGQETYVVYGHCQIDDGSQQRQAMRQPYNPTIPTKKPDEEEAMPELVAAATPGSAPEESAEEQVDAGNLQEKDIEMVMTQAGVDRKKAVATLQKNGGDIINSIMDLTM